MKTPGDQTQQTAKACSSCKVLKILTDFYQKRDRYDHICKECKKSARRNRYHSKLPAEQLDRSVSITHSSNAVGKPDPVDRLLTPEELGVLVSVFRDLKHWKLQAERNK